MTSHPAPDRRGLAVLGLLSVIDVLTPIILPTPGPDDAGPPPWINVLTVVLGLIGLILIALLARGVSRAGLLALVGTRVLSALTGLPAFFAPGVPAWIVAFVAAFILLTAVGCGLLRPALRRPA